MGRVLSFSKANTSLSQDQAKPVFVIVALCVLAALSIAGPTGLLSWNENANVLVERQAQIAMLSVERDGLRNRVDLLHPDGADPDLAAELIRQNLNVVHPDEIVITLDGE